MTTLRPRTFRPLSLALLLVLLPAAARAGDAPQASPAEPAATPAQAAKPAKAKGQGKGKDDAPMVTVAAGPFLMGCNEAVDSGCMDDEKPGRTVEVAAFAIDKDEVTLAQFARCVAAKACSADGLTKPLYGGKEQPEFAAYCNWKKKGRERHPINCVAWAQADAYCTWAGKRLPAEVEWEKAARGTDGRKFPWGNDDDGRGRKVANVADKTAVKTLSSLSTSFGYDDGFVGTAPVGTFPAGASPSGANDMIGNVWEWVADQRESGRVVRGTGWTFDPRLVRVSLRGWTDAAVRSADGGFRCAR